MACFGPSVHPRCDIVRSITGTKERAWKTLSPFLRAGQEASSGKRPGPSCFREEQSQRDLENHKAIFKHVKECADRQRSISTGDRARDNMPLSEYNRVQ